MGQVSLRPLFDRSARSGLVMGVLLSIMSAALLACTKIPIAGTLFMILLLMPPILLVHGIRSMIHLNAAYNTFPAIWVCGLVQMLCGALIASVTTAIFLVLIQPGYMTEYFNEIITIASQSGQVELGVDLQRLPVPGAMEFVSSMFWCTSFFGSILALLAAAILSYTPWLRMRLFKNT